MRLKRILILTSFIFLWATLAQAQNPASQWLHVRVESPEKEESVKVNVPLSLVESVLPMIESDEFQRGKVKIDTEEITVPEMRQIWEVVKSQGDYELASISTRQEKVRISIEGEYFFVRSTEESENEVLVTVPTRVVDALLSGEGDELNISAAVQELSTVGEGDLVMVRDGDTSVRVWIDASSSTQ